MLFILWILEGLALVERRVFRLFVVFVAKSCEQLRHPQEGAASDRVGKDGIMLPSLRDRGGM
jgi:hypothetical protein